MAKSKASRMAKRASERRAKSFVVVLLFLGLFLCMLLTEIFYSVEEEEQPIPKLLFESTPAAVVINETDRWQRVAGTKDKFFVFSAYYDDRRPSSRWVRIIAAARTRTADKVHCHLHYGEESESVAAVNRLIRENWNLKYSAYFVLCPVRGNQVPDAVSVAANQGDAPQNRMSVHRRAAAAADVPPSGMAVCVKPLHYEYDRALDLIEFIELNRLLGANHFLLYNHTSGPRASCVLQQYVREGIATVLPWQLDIKSQKEIRTEGLFASLNDCLYRCMVRKFRFVLMIDLDEFVVPHNASSLSEALERLASKSPDRAGAFSFQNAFFYLQWPDEPGAPPLRTLRKTRRKQRLHAHKQRSKCAVVPDRVVEMGNHFVWEFLPGKAMVNVPPEVAFLHHYRVCEFGGDDCVNTTHVVDRTVYAWKEPLLRAVRRRLKTLETTCDALPTL